MKHALIHLSALFLASPAALHAAELTVAPGGFKTIGEGVAALKAEI